MFINRGSWIIHKIQRKIPALESLFRSSHSQMFFKIVVPRKVDRKASVSESFLIRLQALRTTTLLKRGSWEICKVFKSTLLNTSPVAASDSFRFPVSNFIKKEIWAKIFFPLKKTSSRTNYHQPFITSCSPGIYK